MSRIEIESREQVCQIDGLRVLVREVGEVMGDDDPLVPPANGPLLASPIPHARLLVAPGEGHLLLMDPESAVLEPIRQFLETRDLESAPIWRHSDVPRRLTWTEKLARTQVWSLEKSTSGQNKAVSPRRRGAV